MQESIYQSSNQTICIHQTCKNKGEIINVQMLKFRDYQHYNHRIINKHQVLKRIKVFKANYYTKSQTSTRLFQQLNQIYQKIVALNKYFTDTMDEIQSQLLHYIQFVKKSYSNQLYQQSYYLLLSHFDYFTVKQTLKKVQKYQNINFPYQDYPLQKIQKFNQQFQQSYQISKTQIISIISILKEKLQQIKYTEFLTVKTSQQLKFSKFLKHQVYQVSQDCKKINRIDGESQQKQYQGNLNSSVWGRQVSAIALIQKQINSKTPEITFRIKKMPKDKTFLIGLVNLDIAKQNQFSNCGSKGYWFSNFGRLILNKKESNNNLKEQKNYYKNVSWSVNQGQQITMRLIKNELSFTKKGFIFSDTATLKINQNDLVKLYPAVETQSQNIQIQIVD